MEGGFNLPRSYSPCPGWPEPQEQGWDAGSLQGEQGEEGLRGPSSLPTGLWPQVAGAVPGP